MSSKSTLHFQTKHKTHTLDLMASSGHFYVLILLLLSFNLLQAATAATPQSLIFTIKKDSIKNQYYTEIDIGTPVSYTYVVLDLGAPLTWFDCESGYTSSTYHPIRCGSKRCIQAKGDGCMSCNEFRQRPGCTNNTCAVYAYNPYSNILAGEGLGYDQLGVSETDGRFYLLTKYYKQFQFTCAHKFQLEGLSNRTKGILGLARTRTSLHKQLSLAYKLPHKFALCIPPTNDKGFGTMFVGGGPYFVPTVGLGSNDVSKQLTTTPLLINPVSTAAIHTEGDPSDEYFIGVKSIKVDNKIVTLNTTLLSIDKKGDGGTKISTTTPFTVLERSIYKALLNEFAKKAVLKKMKKVAAVAPFGLCYRSTSVGTTTTGPDVPVIDLILQSESVYWRIYGANSLVKVTNGALCFAFVDGGLNLRTAIVLGGYQLEDTLIEFDIDSSKLGFTSSLLLKNTTCSQSRIF